MRSSAVAAAVTSTPPRLLVLSNLDPHRLLNFESRLGFAASGSHIPAAMEDCPVVQVYNLDDIRNSTGAGPRKAHVLLIQHLREAPDVHAALRQAEKKDQWMVKNPGQVAAARDMELTLGRMAGALAAIRRGGDDLGSAVDDLEKYAKEFAKQKVFGTERTLEAVARPALEVVRCARSPLADVDHLHDLVDAAAGKVQRARELRVRLCPDQAPLTVKSINDITELAPSSDEDSPPQPQLEEPWCVGPVVIVIGLDHMRECSDMYLSLLRNRDFKGWRVLGVEKIRQIDGLDSYLQCLWGNLKKLRQSKILSDAVARGKVLDDLEIHAYALFADASKGMDALKEDPGMVTGVCEVPGQIHDLVKVARTEPMDMSRVRQLAGIAVRVIELIRDDSIVFCRADAMPQFVL